MTVAILPLNLKWTFDDDLVGKDIFDEQGINPDFYRQITEIARSYNQSLKDANKEYSIYTSDLVSFFALDAILDEFILNETTSKDLEDILDQEAMTTIRENLASNYRSLEEDEIDVQDIFSFLIRISLIEKNSPFYPLAELTQAENALDDDQRSKIVDHADIVQVDSNQSLLAKITDPWHKFPNSIPKQIQYIINHWKLSASRKSSLLRVVDLWNEEHKARFGGPGSPQSPDFSDFYPENFSEDSDWMPEVVLLAKNAYVYLSQLSRKYDREITQLNHIPDAELVEIKNRGFTGLWLIGIWERSSASKVIKQRMGNPEATGSAYSLWDYVIAEDLGGHGSYYDLSERAGKIGVRLASDMVPNHTGIYSKWVLEHPDWYIQLDHPPFPSYKFESEDLINDPNISIHLEDHYYHHSDAAVVFKRVDKHTGEERYIYHGNDGTSIPWNDTAQLNYLKQEVREVVINTIIHVAKMFPIIRFDAAMVLTKKHIQRLWFPEPGSGGDIPSRSRFGLTREKFDQLLPNEFWKDVVERIAKEVPNTLLIAEAFWMLEGYFVRSLGMHRVYNSAFMHMLRDEKNAEYRQLIKDTLEYDPRILQRYVNFMSNPDEDTAIGQFGDSDKYFGICTVMITLPGLPMFGHGQIEGFTEKYGMEYKRDYWNETPRHDLIRHHESLIFPLMKKRGIFAPVMNFRLYDAYADGLVNENVYAYSNNNGKEFFLVIYNNRFDQSSGWINSSAAYNCKILHQGENEQKQSKLADDLQISKYYHNGNHYCIFKNFHTDEYIIRKITELCDRGLHFHLDGYRFVIYSDFQVIEDKDGKLKQLYLDLGGQSTSIDKIQELA